MQYLKWTRNYSTPWDVYFEKGTTYRISHISNSCSKANNKYLYYYDLKEKSKHIIYLDLNNLYGHAMFKFLLTSEFKYIDPKEFDLNKDSSSISKGFVLEVHLEYPN